MKIAILSAFYPLRGGIAQFSASLYRALEERHEVKAFTFKRQYPNLFFPGKTQYVTENDKVDVIESEEVLDTVNPFSYYKTAKKINAYHPDLLIINYWMSFFAPSLGVVAKKMNPNTKVISILHNVIPHEEKFFDKAFTQYFLNKNDGFVALSEAVRKDLLSLNPKKSEVALIKHPIYNHFGAKLESEKARKNLKINPLKKTLLFFGFIRKYKGLDLLIAAFEQLDSTYQLVIAGECYGSFDSYQKQIDGSKRKEDIHVFNEYIKDEDVPVFFSAADVCVLPYLTATQSGITSIAFHFELPLIATNTGGLKEIIQHGKTGIIVDEIDVDAIFNSIRSYFESGLKNQFTKNIALMKAEMSWENFGRKLIDFCRSL